MTPMNIDIRGWSQQSLKIGRSTELAKRVFKALAYNVQCAGTSPQNGRGRPTRLTASCGLFKQRHGICEKF